MNQQLYRPFPNRTTQQKAKTWHPHPPLLKPQPTRGHQLGTTTPRRRRLGRPAGRELGLRIDLRCRQRFGGGEDVQQRAADGAATVPWWWVVVVVVVGWVLYSIWFSKFFLFPPLPGEDCCWVGKVKALAVSPCSCQFQGGLSRPELLDESWNMDDIFFIHEKLVSSGVVVVVLLSG